MAGPIANLTIRISAQLAEFQKAFADTSKTLKKFSGEFQGMATKAAAVGAFFGTIAAQIAGSIARGLGRAISDAVTLASKFQNALIGLSSVARAFGADVQATTGAARQLASDGLLPLADAATGLKNLLAAGFNLEQSVRLMEAFKDSAAFGRQGALSFGDAVRSATEGVKNGNSILVDNAGVTKNLSQILKEAGFSAQDLSRASTDVAVRMALYNGIIKETAAQTGDAARLTQTYSGQVSRLSTSYDQFLATLGTVITQNRSVAELIGAIADIFATLTQNLSYNRQGFNLVSDAVLVLTKGLIALVDAIDLVQQSFTWLQNTVNLLGVGVSEFAILLFKFQEKAARLASIIDPAKAFISAAAIKESRDAVVFLEGAVKGFTAVSIENMRRSEAWSTALQGVRGRLTTLASTLAETRGQTVQLGESTGKVATGLTAVGAGAEKASNWIKQFRNSARQLEQQLQAAEKAGVPMVVVLEEFGNQIEHVVNRAPMLGDAIGDATKRAADALREADLASAIAKLMADANDEARKLAGEMQKAGEEAGKRFAEGLIKGNQEFLASLSDQQKRILTLEEDSLDKRLALVAFEFAQKRAALDTHSTFYAQELAIVNAEEAAAAQKATEEWRQHVSDVQDAVGGYGQIFASALQGIPDLLKSALTGGGGFRGAGQAVLSGLGGALGGKAFGSLAAGLSNTLFSTFGVAATSALGVIIPGIGAALGSMLGPLIGKVFDAFKKPLWKKVAHDVGRDWGVQVSDGLAQSIAEEAKRIGSRGDAPLLFLKEIFGEAGGIEAFGLDKAIKKTRDLFSAIDRGSLTSKEAATELGEVFPELTAAVMKTGDVASAEFLELIKLTKDFGLEVEQVTQFLTQQGQRFASGFTTAIKPLEKTFAELTKDWDFERLTAKQKASLQSVVPELERFGRLAVAAFNAAKASGLSDLEAFDAIGGSLDALVPMYERLNQAGITAGSVALQELLNKRALINANRELIEAAGGLNEMALALSYLNGLNVETMADLEAQGLQTFTALREAGFSERDALQQIVPFLETIITAHKDLGIPIDENTQKLIDQAEANGLLKDEALSMNDILMEGFRALIEAVGGDVPDAFKKFKTAAVDAAKTATEEINKIPKKVSVDVEYSQDDWIPGVIHEAASTGGFVGRGRILPFTLGGLVPAQHYDLGGAVGRLVRFSPRGSDTVPAMLTPGEGVVSVRGMEVLGREGLAALNRGMVPGPLDPHGNASISNNVVILPVIRDADIDVDTIMDVVGAYLPDDVRRNSRNHIATRLKAALELAG